MYPNLGSGTNQPSAPPPPSSSSANTSTLSNSGSSRPIGFSSLMNQSNNQSTPYPGGSSSQAPYPTGPPSSSSSSYNNPYPTNTNNYSGYSLPNVGQANQQGNPYAQAPPPPQSGNPYSQPPQGNNPGYQNPYQAQQSAYPAQNQPGPPPYGQQQQQQPPYQSPYSQQGQGRYPSQDPPRPPYNQQQQQTVGAYPPYNQQQPYGNPYGYPQQAPGGYPPYNQQQQQNYPPPPSNNQGYNQNSSGPSAINDRIRSIAGRYEINDALAQRLNILQQFEIVILCDDSGSMNTPVDGTNGTRWDELRSIVQIIMEIGTVFDSNGVDVHFLNRPPMRNVTDARQVVESFIQRPGGLTPLTAALRQIFQSAASRPNSDKRLLVFVATDGAPTDPNGNVDVRSLENLMRNERQAQTTFVTFLACTDDDSSVEYLSQWDRTMQNVDVVDDYKSEREEVRRTKGQNFPFSFGDYVVKALLGAIDPAIDSIDELPGAGGYNNNNYRRF